jgi:hypothetical protein
MSYDLYLYENHLYNAFFKGGSIRNAPVLNNTSKQIEEFWKTDYMRKVMQFYDHKDFNKKAYLEYQLYNEKKE